MALFKLFASGALCWTWTLGCFSGHFSGARAFDRNDLTGYEPSKAVCG